MKKKLLLLSSALLLLVPLQSLPATPGAEAMDRYLPMLEGRKVGILCNHTALVGKTHLVDTLHRLGIDISVVFAPEHGFRGDADAGAHINSYTDQSTGITVLSVYGNNKKPPLSEVRKLDVVLFDIQDVGLRFFTYLSSMHYMMESCAEAGVPMVILDRPNPNGCYVDGPILDMKYRSFVGMHPIPVVHGMTLGELALMINGEGWLDNGLQCNVRVIPCNGYRRGDMYRLPVKPSPNLPNMRSVYLYPTLCLFEGTVVSVGRGTDHPFQAYGHPDLHGRFTFTPESRPGASDPIFKGRPCHGRDLRSMPPDHRVIAGGINLNYIIETYNQLNLGDKYFNRMFELLIGQDYVRTMIRQGHTAAEIKERWASDIDNFKRQRQPYLIYED